MKKIEKKDLDVCKVSDRAGKKPEHKRKRKNAAL